MAGRCQPVGAQSVSDTPPPLRVLVIASLFPDETRPNFGVFVERQLLEVVKNPDVELTVVAPIGIAPWPLSLHPHYRKFAHIPLKQEWKGIIVHRPRFTQWPGTGGKYAPTNMTKAVLRLLHKTDLTDRFDVVDAQFFYPDGPAAIAVGEALKLPVSIKARGADISYWGKQDATATQVREAGLKAAGLLAVSAAMRNDMATLGMPKDRITVHYTGLDRERFKPINRDQAKAAFNLTGPVISTVGALIPRKGQDIVIRALPSLPGVTYAIAGMGEDRSRLEALTRELNVDDRVRFLGSVPHKEIPTLLAASDAMVLVSESEGLANAWLEALACGASVVMSNVGGAPELAEGTIGAHIVERTPEAVTQSVEAILANPPVADAVAASVNERFSWHKNARELIQHWKKLAG